MITWIESHPVISGWMFTIFTAALCTLGGFVLAHHRRVRRHSEEIAAIKRKHEDDINDIKAKHEHDVSMISKEIDEVKDVAQITTVQVVNHLEKLSDEIKVIGKDVAYMRGRYDKENDRAS